MKFVALISGGKDSIYSIMECIRNGHELIACAHLAPRRVGSNPGDNDNEEESYMYQTAASECISTMVEECLGVPLILREIVGRSKDTSLVYDHDQQQRQEEHDGKEHAKKDESDDTNVKDEVEDLYHLLLQVQNVYPSITAVSSGAILSTYQRTRIESVCSRLNLTPLGYLWRMGPQRSLLKCMLDDGIHAVLVKVASPPGLMPRKHLNKSLGDLFYGGVFDRLKDRFDFHICGEGGEYETLVLDCPIFRKRLLLEEVDVLEGYDGVGVLKVIKWCAVEKEEEKGNRDWKDRGLLHQRIQETQEKDTVEMQANDTSKIMSDHSIALDREATKLPTLKYLPHIKILPGGLAHISELVSQSIPSVSNGSILNSLSQDEIEAELAVLEAKSIFDTLKQTLSRINWNLQSYSNNRSNYIHSPNIPTATAQDVVFVHLYLSSITHFAKINTHYRQFFGTILPPSRSCVAVGKNVLPGGRRVMLDCIIQRGSGAYMRVRPDESSIAMDTKGDSTQSEMDLFVRQAKMNPHHTLRSTLHVQSISHWAPVCVGPYSQANSLRSGLMFLAGQIGLVPATMTLKNGEGCGWRDELKQCWKNAASVLDALSGNLQDILGGLVYVGSGIVFSDTVSTDDISSNDSSKEKGKHVTSDQVWEEAYQICLAALKCNGTVIAGYADDISSSKTADSGELYGGYEDEETWKEVMAAEARASTQVMEDGVKQVELGSKLKEESEVSDFIPILMVAIPQMPVGAVTEVELICATNKASSCLGLRTSYENSVSSNSEEEDDGDLNVSRNIYWDLGYGDQALAQDSNNLSSTYNKMKINSFVRCAGNGCLAVTHTVASLPLEIDADINDSLAIDTEQVLEDMIHSVMQCVEVKAGLNLLNVLHIRLFYISTDGDDAMRLRCALHSVLDSNWTSEYRNIDGENNRHKNGRRQSNRRNIPACSVIPVQSIFMPTLDESKESVRCKFAMQVIAADLVHTETNMWINYGRSYV